MNRNHQRRTVSIRIDPVAYQYMKTKPNVSKYVEALVIQDMQVRRKEAIYEAITSRMLKDTEFLILLSKTLSERASKPLVTGGVDLNPDWGA